MDYQREYEICRTLAEERLKEFFSESCPQKDLLEAMRYSLLAGGKRIRPVLTMKFCRQPEEAWKKHWSMPVLWKCFIPTR